MSSLAPTTVKTCIRTIYMTNTQYTISLCIEHINIALENTCATEAPYICITYAICVSHSRHRWPPWNLRFKCTPVRSFNWDIIINGRVSQRFRNQMVSFFFTPSLLDTCGFLSPHSPSDLHQFVQPLPYRHVHMPTLQVWCTKSCPNDQIITFNRIDF